MRPAAARTRDSTGRWTSRTEWRRARSGHAGRGVVAAPPRQRSGGGLYRDPRTVVPGSSTPISLTSAVLQRHRRHGPGRVRLTPAPPGTALRGRPRRYPPATARLTVGAGRNLNVHRRGGRCMRSPRVECDGPRQRPRPVGQSGWSDSARSVACGPPPWTGRTSYSREATLSAGRRRCFSGRGCLIPRPARP